MARRSKIVGTLPISFYDLGSAAAPNIDLRREILYTRLSDRLAELSVRIPVFLINEAQMDSITPSHLTRGLNKLGVERRLRQALEQAREQHETSERWPEEVSPLQRAWDDIQRGIERATPEGEPNSHTYWTRFTPVGLYFGRSSQSLNLRALSQLAHPTQTYLGLPKIDSNNLTPPVIFICPERVLNWADRLGIDPNLVFDKVLYHELGHAYMDRGDKLTDAVYQTPWRRVIEESLANWIAFSQFNKIEARYVQKLISTQPAEYQGYLVVNRLRRLPFDNTVLGGAATEYYEYRIEDWWAVVRRYGHDLLFIFEKLYHNYYRHLEDTWVERFSYDADTGRLQHWRRFKQGQPLFKNRSIREEEPFWQALAAQVLLEV